MPRRIVLLIEYDGGTYAGSQLQADQPTVQSVLEASIEETAGERVRVAMAGRTDAGVHAHGQVASFLTETKIEVSSIAAALNAHLPRSVSVLAAAGVDIDFDVRRHALRRHYRYLIENRRGRPALDRGKVWHVASPLDATTMADAARKLIGEHDFAAFASAPQAGASTVRHLYDFDVTLEGSRVNCDVIANAFLPHQVRRMVGALVEVGRGKLTPNQYADLLNGPPSSAGPSAPAGGLYLLGVEYAESPFGAHSGTGFTSPALIG